MPGSLLRSGGPTGNGGKGHTSEGVGLGVRLVSPGWERGCGREVRTLRANRETMTKTVNKSGAHLSGETQWEDTRVLLPPGFQSELDGRGGVGRGEMFQPSRYSSSRRRRLSRRWISCTRYLAERPLSRRVSVYGDLHRGWTPDWWGTGTMSRARVRGRGRMEGLRKTS